MFRFFSCNAIPLSIGDSSTAGETVPGEEYTCLARVEPYGILSSHHFDVHLPEITLREESTVYLLL